MAALLSIERLTVRLGAFTAVREVSFTVDAGETVALVGASGSGKTTILRAVMGLLPARARATGQLVWRERTGGEVNLLALAERARRARRGREIGWVPQSPQAALDPRQRAGAAVRERGGNVADRLRQVGLDPERAEDYPFQWSGGMQQRLLVAMALAQRPRLLLADEPTAALDTLHQAQLLALLRCLMREPAAVDELQALCLVTHDLAVAALVADRIVVLEQGSVVEQGSAAQVFGSPRAAATRGMVAAQPRIEAAAAPRPGRAARAEER